MIHGPCPTCSCRDNFPGAQNAFKEKFDNAATFNCAWHLAQA